MVTLLTAPIWLLGAIVNYEFLPGLPIAALAIVCPALAAAILSFHEGGRDGLATLIRRAVDFRGAKRWLVPTLLINPLLFGFVLVVARQLNPDIPDPDTSLLSVSVLSALFLPTAVLEEIGWSGYALDRLQARTAPIWSALLLGGFWALWHVPALIQAGRAIDWIAWWLLWTVSARFIMVWLYNWSGRSVMAVALYHATSNLCWQLYPVHGSYFDPRLSGLATCAVAIALFALSGRAEKNAHK